MTPDPRIPDFPGALVEHDGQIYNLHRNYRDRDGRVWAATRRTLPDPVWARHRDEPGIPLAVLIAERGPLELVGDPYFDATDAELGAMLNGGTR